MAMKLSTGKVAFLIEFDNGDKDCIYFNPCDPNLAFRLTEFQTRTQSKLEGIDFDNSENSNNINTYKKVQDLVCEEIDIAFGSEISKTIFKYCAPFAIVNGEYYVIQFIDAIRPEIEKHIKKANAEIEKKMKKHLEKYNL